MRTHSCLRTVQPLGDFFRRAAFHITQHQSGPLTAGQQAQPIFEIVAVLRAQQNLFGRFVRAFRVDIDFAVRDAAVPPQKIDGGVSRNSRKPVRRLLLVLELVLALQRFDEGFLGEVLRIRDIPYNPVNLYEDTPQIIGDKTVLPLVGLERGLD